MTEKTEAPAHEHIKSARDLAVCAHDLRGTLTVIAGYANTLRRHCDLSAEQREQALTGIESAVKRADRMICDTLDGMIAAGSGVGATQLAQLVQIAAADARVAHGREVVEHVSADPQVTGDETSLARVLENLLSNAAKYSPSGPIDISLWVDGPIAVVEVADLGPGIPETERRAVLEPFARLERDLNAPGTGLGLTVVNSVVTRTGGYVKIDDRPGGGATVRLYLPIV